MLLPDSVCAIELRGMADAIAAKLGPHAHDRKRFLVNAKQQVWGSIVSEALRRGDVCSREELDVSEKARAALQLEFEQALHRDRLRSNDNDAKARSDLAAQRDEHENAAQRFELELQRAKGFLERLGAQAGPAGEFHIGPARLLYVAMRTSEASLRRNVRRIFK